MEKSLPRAFLVELLGTFALVFFAAGVVLVNANAGPPGSAPLGPVQPGVVGIAFVQGVSYAVLLTATLPVSGGYLNPALAVMLWVFNRLDSLRAAALVAAQLSGAVLAGAWLRFGGIWNPEVLAETQMGTPHLNPVLYPVITRGTQLAGTGLELTLTFFLVFAIFSTVSRVRRSGWMGGAALAAGVVFAFPLTGAAVNPARWFGTVWWEFSLEGTAGRGPLADVFVYVAGPVLGALLGGAFSFRFMLPAQARVMALAEPAQPAPAKVRKS